jgi:AcrR family transcriptional regulator
VTADDSSRPLRRPDGRDKVADGEPQLGLRERNKLQRTDRILAAALELLRDDPESSPTVERIAARAHVAPMTVFNLVGNWDQIWSALADRALEGLDVGSIQADDPHQRASQIVDAVVSTIVADPAVFRALLSRWSAAGRVLEHDPTDALTSCLQEAADRGMLARGVNVRRYGEVIATGLLGTIHLWTAGILSDTGLRSRAREIVDVVFAAATVDR